MQHDMFDKPIAEIRALRVFDHSKLTTSLSLEFRFVGEDKWHPVKVEAFEINTSENNDESGLPATTDDR